MRMSGRVPSCCVALVLALTSVSAIRKLNSIDDLKPIGFGDTVPKHSLLLLHWFANIIEIEPNDDMRLTFDPINNYGSHHYGNFDGLLPRNHRYYTVGNLKQNASQHLKLPDYIVHPRTGYRGWNRDRVIMRVSRQNTGGQVYHRVDQVYITQHYDTSEDGRDYDPEHTYEISSSLLRQIRQFTVGANQQSLESLRNSFGSSTNDSQLNEIRITWDNLACLGLLLFIAVQERHRFINLSRRPGSIFRTGSRKNSAGIIDPLDFAWALILYLLLDSLHPVITHLLRKCFQYCNTDLV